jgi:periplasmic protein TonB
MTRPQVTALPLSIAAHGAALATAIGLSILPAQLPPARAAAPEPPTLQVVRLPDMPERRPARTGARGPVAARVARPALAMPDVSAPAPEELAPGDVGEELPAGIGGDSMPPCLGCDLGGLGPVEPGPPHAGSGGRAGGPVRIGGVIREPRKLRHVDPIYPEIARVARVQGAVVLECTLTPEGHVSDVRVLSGHPLLDAAALYAVQQWRFTPTLLNGVPVPVLMTVRVRFQLH